MATYVFMVLLDRRTTEAELGKFVAGGADDATFGTERGLPIVEFDREAASLTEAVASAVRDLNDAGMTMVRVIFDHADIADA